MRPARRISHNHILTVIPAAIAKTAAESEKERQDSDIRAIMRSV